MKLTLGKPIGKRTVFVFHDKEPLEVKTLPIYKVKIKGKEQEVIVDKSRKKGWLVISEPLPATLGGTLPDIIEIGGEIIKWK